MGTKSSPHGNDEEWCLNHVKRGKNGKHELSSNINGEMKWNKLVKGSEETKESERSRWEWDMGKKLMKDIEELKKGEKSTGEWVILKHWSVNFHIQAARIKGNGWFRFNSLLIKYKFTKLFMEKISFMYNELLNYYFTLHVTKIINS